jgi:hypothetical protein
MTNEDNTSFLKLIDSGSVKPKFMKWYAYPNSMRFHALKESLSNAHNSKLLTGPWIRLISKGHDTCLRNLWGEEISKPHLSCFGICPGANTTPREAMDGHNAMNTLAAEISKLYENLTPQFSVVESHLQWQDHKAQLCRTHLFDHQSSAWRDILPS